METLIYINGELVPEREAKISIFDIGFMYSAVFYESLRTFKHKLYRLDDHLDRLDRTLRYAGLPSLVSKDEMARVLEKTIEANIGLFEEDDDCWICGQATPGNGFPQPLMKGKRGQPTVIAYVSPMPYDEYADCYLHGKPAVISRVPNIPNSVVDPRGKTRFRLHYFMAKLETNVRDPEALCASTRHPGISDRRYRSERVLCIQGNALHPDHAEYPGRHQQADGHRTGRRAGDTRSAKKT